MRKILIIFAIIMNIFVSNAQYATKHYIAPSPWQYWSNANEIVLTTRETTPVTVTLKKSNGTLITTLTVVALTPVSYRFVGTPGSLQKNAINTVLSDRGLIVEADAPVSVNMRNIASDSPGTTNLTIKGNASLVSFGNEGIGLQFRLGYYRDNFAGIATGAPVYSVMAIQDATIVTLNGTAIGILNAGQSRLFTANIGALLSANKPIVANAGAYGDTPGGCGGNGEDGVVDQVAPVNMLGKKYLVVRGEGVAGTGPTLPEQTTIIATEASTVLQVINYNAAGTQVGSVNYNLGLPGDHVTIFQGDAATAYSSTYISAGKPVVVYSGTADGCETDMSTVLPIGGCAGLSDVSTRKFIDFNNNNLDYFGYCILESATTPVLMNGSNLEGLIGTPRVAIGTTGFYIIRFTNVNLGNPTNINLTSTAKLTTSIIQQGQGSSMSGFFSAFSESPEPPAEVSSNPDCTYTLSTTAGLEPYQWYLDGLPIAGAIAQTYTAGASGNYSVKGTQSCGPTAQSAPLYVEVTPCGDLSVTKQVTSITGNQAVFVITASNLGSAQDDGVAVIDVLPSGYTFISATPSAGTYNNVNGLWDIGTLMAGASATLTVNVTINATGNFINTAAISGSTADTDTTNNTAQAEARVSSITLTKTAQQAIYYNPGEIINYSIVLTNTGQTALTAVAITDTNADAGSVNPATIPTLNPGDSVTITAVHTITATDVSNGFVLNQASASGLNTSGLTVSVLSDDPSTAAVSDPTKSIVTVAADLVTVNTNNQTIYTPGTSTVYTITITNNGPSTAQNIVVSDALPAGTTVMSWTNSLGQSGSGPLNETLPTMANGEIVTYTVTLDIPSNFTGTLTNTVTVSSDTTDPSPACSQCTDIDNSCTPPTLAAAGPLKKCDDFVADGLTEVNLTQFNSTITQGNTNWQVVFYSTPADLAAGTPIPNPQAFPTTTPYNQTVIVEVINETNCKSYSTLDIIIGSKPAPVLLTQEQLCDNSTHRFDLTQYETAILNGETGTSVTGYYTAPQNAEIAAGAISGTDSYEITSSLAVFYLRIENASGCYTISELRLTILGLPTVSIPAQLALCRDEFGDVTPEVLATGLSTTDYTFKWYYNAALLPDTGNSLSVSQAGTYKVEVTSQLGCSGTSVASEVIISNGPDSFTASVLTGYFAGSAAIEGIAVGTGDFVYWLDDGAEQESGLFKDVIGGTHIIHVRDANGCGKTLSVVLHVIDYPKFFTPNGDTFNDFWNIPGIKDQQQAIIYIFDRYGKLLTSLRPYGPGWDGTFNGYPLPSTDYWFKVLYTEDGIAQEFRSHFALKR